MAGRTFHFPGFSIVEGDIKVDVSLDRFEKQFQEAQFWLDSQIMTDMVPYMPFRNGTFIQQTRRLSSSLAGSGKVVAGAPPQGRFLYYGKVMVGETSRSPWAMKGEKKIVTDRPLKYGNPKATSEWFETAKKNHGRNWVEGVKKRAGGK